MRAKFDYGQFEIVPWIKLSDFYNKVAALYERQFGLVRLIIAAVIVLGITNTMMMSVLERTSEIGTALAIGRKRSAILRGFVLEGGLLGIAGGVVGLVTGLLLAHAISAIGIPMPPSPGMSRGFVAGITITPGTRDGGARPCHSLGADCERLSGLAGVPDEHRGCTQGRPLRARSLMFELALRNVLRHGFRTAMTFSAVSIGVAALILAGGFVQDILIQLGEAIIHSQTGHLQIVRPGYLGSGSRSAEKHLLDRLDQLRATAARCR